MDKLGRQRWRDDRIGYEMMTVHVQCDLILLRHGHSKKKCSEFVLSLFYFKVCVAWRF